MRRLRLNWAMPRRVVGVFFFIFFSALLLACGGDPDETDTGEGGNGSSSSSGTAAGGSTSSSSSSSSSSGGGGDVCYPSVENNWCVDAEACECLPTPTSSEDFCATTQDMGYELCPVGGNVCGQGKAQCGYNLGLGVNYEAPNADCLQYVNGDTWRVGNDQFVSFSSLDENGYGHFNGVFVPSAIYYDGYTMSGKKILWNVTNRATAEFGIGEFGPDCLTFTVRLYDPGAMDNDPRYEGEAVWISD